MASSDQQQCHPEDSIHVLCNALEAGVTNIRPHRLTIDDSGISYQKITDEGAGVGFISVIAWDRLSGIKINHDVLQFYSKSGLKLIFFIASQGTLGSEMDAKYHSLNLCSTRAEVQRWIYKAEEIATKNGEKLVDSDSARQLPVACSSAASSLSVTSMSESSQEDLKVTTTQQPEHLTVGMRIVTDLERQAREVFQRRQQAKASCVVSLTQLLRDIDEMRPHMDRLIVHYPERVADSDVELLRNAGFKVAVYVVGGHTAIAW